MLSISQKQDRESKEEKTECREQRTEKGQTGLEVMAFIAFILLAFSVAYLSLTSKTLSAINADAYEDANWIAAKVSSEVNTAMAEGSGYSKTFRLPDTIQSSNYTILVEQGTVFIDWSEKSVASYTIAENISGNFTGGWNFVENREGVIFAN